MAGGVEIAPQSEGGKNVLWKETTGKNFGDQLAQQFSCSCSGSCHDFRRYLCNLCTIIDAIFSFNSTHLFT